MDIKTTFYFYIKMVDIHWTHGALSMPLLFLCIKKMLAIVKSPMTMKNHSNGHYPSDRMQLWMFNMLMLSYYL